MNPSEKWPKIEQVEISEKKQISWSENTPSALSSSTITKIREENMDFSGFGEKSNDKKESPVDKMKTRSEILKQNLDDRIESSVWIEKVDFDELARKNLGWRADTPENIEEVKKLLREQYLKWEIEKLNTIKEIEVDWKKISITEKQRILDSNPDIKEAFWQINDKRFQDEMLVLYWEDKVKTFSAIFQQFKT